MAPKPITTLVQGEQLTLREISERYRIAYEAVRERYYRAGKRGDDLIKPARKLGRDKRVILGMLNKDIAGVDIARWIGCQPQNVSYYKTTYLD